MTIKYEMSEDKSILFRNNEDGSLTLIPIDESNSDYQAYLNKDKPQTPAVLDETPAE